MLASLLVLALAGVAVSVVITRVNASGVGALRSRIVSVAQSQLGYRTDPPNTYCNKFSASWSAGVNDCGNGNLDEQWCADFAAWVWKQAGAQVDYELAPGHLNSNSASFYVWGVQHGTWHPVGTPYTPQPGDVAVYGLDTSDVTAAHVALVTASTGDQAAPDVVNGDGDQTGFSVVEVGLHQAYADASGKHAPLSGYASPVLPTASGGA